MRKFSKRSKKYFISALVFLVTFNPFVPVLAMAEEEIITESVSIEASPSPTSSPEAIIETGMAVAVAESESQVNTTAVNSEIETATILVTGESGEASVILFPLSSPTTASTPEPSPSPSPEPSIEPTAMPVPEATESANIEVVNQAENITATQAEATTGENSQTTAGAATMTTGDAVAIATSLSLTNTTLINSTLLVGVIAILQAWNGDIVVDPMREQSELLSPVSTLVGLVEIDNTQTTVETITTASAGTGDNTQIASGSATMTTGDAVAIAQNNVMVNTTMIGTDIFTLLADNLWLWSGNILNWESPGSITPASSISNMSSQNEVGCGGTCSFNLEVDNQAHVSTTTSAMASTGGNTQIVSGDSEMTTGDAMAGAVSNTLVNTTLIDSRYRQLSLLLFAPWSGNLVFAYPDILVTAEAPEQVVEGEMINYTVTVKNRGYGMGVGVGLINQITNDEHVVYETSENWEGLGASETIVKTFSLPTDGRAGHTVRLIATAKSENVEETMINNTAVAQTIVVPRPNTTNSSSESETEQPTEVPKLRLESQNNIHDYVYPGDGVTYDMMIYNDGPVGAKDIILIQDFYAPDGKQISKFQGKVGDLALNQKKTVRFVLRTGSEMPEGEYFTQSVAHGQSDQGDGTDSNTVRNPVPLKLKWIASSGEILGVQAVQAISSEPQYILGTAIQNNSCAECLSWPWYVAITLGSTVYYWMCRRRQDFGRAIRMGLTLPLSAYGGLLLSNPNCSNGLVMMPSAGFFCIWFLPISFGIYLAMMKGGQMIGGMKSFLTEKI